MKLNFDCEKILADCGLPWVRYNYYTAIGKLGLANKEKAEIKKDERIKALINECLDWPNPPILRHNDAKHIIHKICLLLDFGLNVDDEEMELIAKKILSYQDDNAAFLSLINIPKAFGGDDVAKMQWMLCDFPILLYIMIKLGFKDNKEVLKSINYLKDLSSDNGWRCVGSVDKFRGPGRKTDHCPYANLVSLKAFSLLPQYHSEDFIKNSLDSIIEMWETQSSRKYYMFGIGTDFKKLKYPNLWFEIVHVLRILSKYEYARKQEAYIEMLQIVKEKQQQNGGFIPESIYMAYKGWGFGQKKEISPMLSYYIWEIFEGQNR